MKPKLYEIRYERETKYNRENAVKLRDLIEKTREPFAMAINSMGVQTVKRGTRGKEFKKGLPYPAEILMEQVKGWKDEYNTIIGKSAVYKIIRREYRGAVIEFDYRTVKDMGNALRMIKDRIREMRQRDKHIQVVDGLHGNLDNRIYHRKPMQFIREFNGKRLQLPKRPHDNAEYVGIEIECITPRGMDLTPLLPFAKYVEVGGDGSIEHGNTETGTEVRVCMKRNEVREVLPSLMETLRSMGARVNKSCGLHVHLDQRNNKEPEKVFQHLVRSLGLLYTTVPESRRRNRYCKRNRHADFSSAVRGDRYKAINASAFHRYHTIEVRLFGGTLDGLKVTNWIEVLFAIAYGETVMRCPKTFDTALKYWKLSDENLKWLKDRQAKFSSLNVGMPVSEHETEDNQALLDENQSDDEDEEGQNCYNCGCNLEDGCQCDSCEDCNPAEEAA